MNNQEQEFQHQHSLETYRSLISISVEGFKAMLLVNGGAVVAFLAFLSSASPAKPEILPLAAKPLWWLISALASNVIIFMMSYATQYVLFLEGRSKIKEGRHLIPLCAAFAFCLICVGCFIKGAFVSLDVLSTPDRNLIHISKHRNQTVNPTVPL